MAMSSAQDRTVRILVVDDDPIIRLFCEKLLKEAGYEVTSAEGSPEAMALCASSSSPFDLALVDVFLPPPDFHLASDASSYHRVNGPEMVLQMLTVMGKLRCIYMSGHSAADLAKQGILLGSVPFLPKPLAKERLVAAVADALTAPPMQWIKPEDPSPKSDVQWVD